MARPFASWVQNCSAALLPHNKGKKLVTVGILGDRSTHNTADLINAQLFGSRRVFQQGCREPSECLQPSVSSKIDAFLSKDDFVLYLLFGREWEPMFHMDSVTNRVAMQPDKHTLESMDFLFRACNVVLFVSSRCRFDMSWLKELKAVLAIRENQVPTKPMRNNSAAPSFLFAFPLPKSIEEASSRRKNELVSKMEESLENQIQFVLKKTSIVDRPRSKPLFGSLPPKGEKFVHLFTKEGSMARPRNRKPKQAYQPPAKGNATATGSSSAIQTAEIMALLDAVSLQKATRRGDYGLYDYINDAVKELKGKQRSEKRYGHRADLPTLEAFISNAQNWLKGMCREQQQEPSTLPPQSTAAANERDKISGIAMGKHKSKRKPPPKHKVVSALETQFNCPFCNHEKSCEVKMDRDRNVGYIKCLVCTEDFQTNINSLSEAIDVYGDWIDACEAANQ